MDIINRLLDLRYRSGDATTYYQDMAAHSDLFEQLYEQDWRSTSFVCGPLSGEDREEKRNIVCLSHVINFFSACTSTRCINQLPYYARFNADDPRDFDLKFRIFYYPRIARSQQVLVTRGWKHSKGCRKEVAFAREMGKPVYLVTLPESRVTLAEAATMSEETLRLHACALTWAREPQQAKPTYEPWQAYATLLD